jgi:hypothetical protein
MSFRSSLSQRCAVLKPQIGSMSSWNTIQTTYVAPVGLQSVPCFFYPERGGEYPDTERTVALDTVVFDFLPTVSVEATDRISFDGAEYHVIQSVLVGGGHHRKVRAQKIVVSK